MIFHDFSSERTMKNIKKTSIYTDQKRLLKLIKTNPVLVHKITDFMNAGNDENDNVKIQQCQM